MHYLVFMTTTQYVANDWFHSTVFVFCIKHVSYGQTASKPFQNEFCMGVKVNKHHFVSVVGTFCNQKCENKTE